MMKIRLELLVISSILFTGLLVASFGTNTPEANAARLTSLLDRTPAAAEMQYQHLRKRATELETEEIHSFSSGNHFPIECMHSPSPIGKSS